MVLFGNEGREHPPGMLGWAQAFQARRAIAGAAWGLARNITQTRKKAASGALPHQYPPFAAQIDSHQIHIRCAASSYGRPEGGCIPARKAAPRTSMCVSSSTWPWRSSRRMVWRPGRGSQAALGPWPMVRPAACQRRARAAAPAGTAAVRRRRWLAGGMSGYIARRIVYYSVVIATESIYRAAFVKRKRICIRSAVSARRYRDYSARCVAVA